MCVNEINTLSSLCFVKRVNKRSVKKKSNLLQKPKQVIKTLTVMIRKIADQKARWPHVRHAPWCGRLSHVHAHNHITRARCHRHVISACSMIIEHKAQNTPAAGFSKVTRTFRARKASCQTVIRLF